MPDEKPKFADRLSPITKAALLVGLVAAVVVGVLVSILMNPAAGVLVGLLVLIAVAVVTGLTLETNEPHATPVQHPLDTTVVVEPTEPTGIDPEQPQA